MKILWKSHVFHPRPRACSSEDAHAQAMVASFCGRSFDDGETNEIAARIRRATANINVEIETLLEFLTHKGALAWADEWGLSQPASS